MNLRALKEEFLVEVIRGGRTEDSIDDKELSHAISRGSFLDHMIKKDQAELQELKRVIVNRARLFLAGKGTITFHYGEVGARVRIEYDAIIDEKSIDELVRILEGRWSDLVHVRTQYKPSRRLIEIAADDEKTRKLITVREGSPRITFER
jgi:hypothetical protein